MSEERVRVAFIGAGKQANWRIVKPGGTPDPTKDGGTESLIASGVTPLNRVGALR